MRRRKNKKGQKWLKKVQSRASPRSQQESHQILLDSFSEADLSQWKAMSEERTLYEYQLFYCLESQRAAVYDHLLEILRTESETKLEVDGWRRNHATKYHPFSAAGSILQIGGRFNFGRRIDPLDSSRFLPFHALYFAEDIETSYRERFSQPNSGPFDRFDFALIKASSYGITEVKISANQIFDLTSVTRLQKLMEVLRKFEIPRELAKLAEKIGISGLQVLRTPLQMHKSLLEDNWRARPQQLSVPSNSQIFGKMLFDAGAEGVLYPSTKGNGKCLALFPKRFKNSESYVESINTSSSSVSRLDRHTYSDFSCLTPGRIHH